MRSLIIVEHDHQHLKNATLHTITAATQITPEVDVMVIGYQAQAVAEAAAVMAGVKQVWLTDNLCYQHQLAENSAACLFMHIQQQHYTHIYVPATTFGKNLLPRLAALLNVTMISDVTKILTDDTFERPIYAGNVLATVQSHAPIKCLSIRATAFAAASKQNQPATITPVAMAIENKFSQFKQADLTQSSRPELATARVVVAGGRGLKSAENFHLLEAIADELQGAVGASRAAVDAGFAPNDYQVGQTGKIVAPDLYIAVGISGAIQHLAGMKESKIVVAINNDADAPIFQMADYALVGDLFVILPELKNKLAASKLNK